MAKSRKNKITAAVCTYNRYDLLDKCLVSLLSQTLSDKEFEVIVVDNSPHCAESGAFKKKYDGKANIRYLIEDTPGLSNARNVAANAADSPIVAYIDDDAIASSNWLEEVLHAFETFGDSAGAVGGKIDPIWISEKPHWLPDSLLPSLTILDWGGGLRVARSDEWIAGANFSIRADALLAAGGFATALGRVGSGNVLLSNEEIKVLDYLRDNDYKIIWAPGAAVEHLVDPRRLNQGWLRSRAAWQAVSDLVADRDQSNVDQSWRSIRDYISSIPPKFRTPRGLFRDTEDPELFEKQVGVTYSITNLLLRGYLVPDD